MALRPLTLLAALLLVFVGLSPPLTAAQDISNTLRKLTDIESEINRLASLPLRSSQLRGATHVEERLTDGELFFRLQDYLRASVIFTDIVDSYPSHPAYPDALFLLGESLFHAGDYLGARSRFRQILDRADEGRFRPYLQRTLGRLIEIAIRTHDFSGVEDYFARLSRLPTSEVEAATNYFRAKYLYSVAVEGGEPDAGEGGIQPPAEVDQGRLEQARAAFEAIPQRAPYYVQAQYFIGVIYTIRGQYEQAIRAFQKVASVKADDPKQRKVVDLARLALGRLYYETDQLDTAARAYQSVPRTSGDFDVALYEIAWAHIRKGDSTQAERALEVLGVAVPESRHIPDGMVLRGNLLLRNGSFNKADTVFEQVADQFEPVRKQLDEMVADQPGGSAYFRNLVRENMETFDVTNFVPPLALQWTDFEGDMKHAMQILADLAQARRLVEETENIVRRMTAVMSSPNPVNIFRDLRGHRERTVGLRNRLARIRKELMAAEQKAARSGGSAELSQTRKRRLQIEQMMGGMPTDADDIQLRNARIVNQFTMLDKDLSKLEVQLMGMEARIVATDRFMTDTMKDREDTEGVVAIRQELEQQRDAIAEYRRSARSLREDIETGKLQVGVGDANYSRDQELREEYGRLVARERELLGAAGSARARDVDSAFFRLTRAEAELDQHDARVDQIVGERVREMKNVLAEENEKLGGYRAKLEELGNEAEIVIGAVTRDSYARIQKRFYDLVLKADVGRVDVSWAEREEHRMRVEMLTRERTRQLQVLDDEFKEIMDEKTERGNQ